MNGLCEECGTEGLVADAIDGEFQCRECASKTHGAPVRLKRITLGGVPLHVMWVAA